MSKKQQPESPQFGGRGQHPVNARRTVDGWITSGVAYEDYTRMSTQQHKPSGERRLPTPQWAVNDPMLRELLVAFMEERAGFRKRQNGPLMPRLERAKAAIIAQRPRMLATLDKLCSAYVQIKRAGGKYDEMPDDVVLDILENIEGKKPLPCMAQAARQFLEARDKRFLEIEIEGIDTYLRYTTNGGADVVAAIVYLYYRAGLDSVGVGAELGLKPPHVRQTLWRLHDTWKQMHGASHAGANSGAADTQIANGEPANANPLRELAPPPEFLFGGL